MIERRNEDGTLRYVVSEPGDPPAPEHDADACGQCTFVAHPDFITVTQEQIGQAHLSPARLMLAGVGLYDLERVIVRLGLFVLPGWTGHNTFWLFQCPSCEKLCRDYLHGHRPYLRCDGCSSRLPVGGDRFYAAAGLPKPPSAREEGERLARLWDEARR